MAKRRGRYQIESEAENELEDTMAQYLIQTPKILLDDGCQVEFLIGMTVEVNFKARVDDKETFRLMIERHTTNSHHAKYELLARHSIVLLRLEYEASPHLNPDGSLVPCPHLHTYKKGFGDRWARVVGDEFGRPDSLLDCLHGFLEYCNVVQLPGISPVRTLWG